MQMSTRFANARFKPTAMAELCRSDIALKCRMRDGGGCSDIESSCSVLRFPERLGVWAREVHEGKEPGVGEFALRNAARPIR